METPEIIRGTIENVVYHNDGNDYTVLEISDENECLITAVGTLPFCAEGEKVTLVGNYIYHKEYGRQFAVTSFEKTLPSEEEDIIKYLSARTVKGIGPVTALKIVNRFGKETFDVIEHHPEWLADISGITAKKAAEISKSFCEQADLRGVMMFCKDYMGTAQITKVYKRFGAGAVGLIRENPYVLCQSETGLSFEKADEIARSLGIAKDDRERLFYGISYVLSYNAESYGHTCLPFAKLVAASASLLEVDEKTVEKYLNEFIKQGRLCSYFSDDTRKIMLKSTDFDETNIASTLQRLLREVTAFDYENAVNLIQKAEITSGITYDSVQKKALEEALRSGVLIVTGGPGTGKTTIVRALLSMFRSLGLKTVLSAPTGRAAKRLSEATSEEAKTVHRMLEMTRTENDDRVVYNRNERNPLDEAVVIVDEASMLDLSLTSALMSALRRHSRLILIGDIDQLPSVGAGNVLSDLICSERVPTIRLSKIFRQSEESLIVTNAHRINAGEMPVLTKKDGDFFFLPREDENTIPETVVELITQRLPRAYGQKVTEEIQVISSSKKGVAGVDALNTLLQDKLHPQASFCNEKAAHGIVFREGDRVMQITNDYEIQWEKNGAVGIGLFNGDIGVIERIDLHEHFMKIRFDDKIAHYTFDLLDELDLAYAVTVHKSQGSEYPIVIFPAYSCPPMLKTRNLLYTALTRAKRMVIVVGKKEVLREMIENYREVLRYTTLTERLVAFT